MRCSRCQTFALQHYIISDPILLQPSLAALKLSAETGCDFCLLLYTALINDNSGDKIETHLQFPSDGPGQGGDDDTAAVRIEYFSETILRQNAHTQRLKIRVFAGSGDYEAVIPRITSNLHVFSKTDDPSAFYLCGREVGRDPTAEPLFARIVEWLNICDEHHSLCRKAHEPELPTRYLDVGPPDGSVNPILCANTTVQHGRYAALSYAWGLTQTFVTTPRNLDSFIHSIQVSELSQSLQDAILVTRKLGLRFLWIDALCILQQEPDLADFLREAPKMGGYYNNAYITITAGCSADSRDGFLAARPAPAAKPCALEYSWQDGTCHSTQKGTAYACLVASTGTGPLMSRTWTFQEAQLSPRSLIFGKGQVTFACQTLRHREDGDISASSFTRGTLPLSLLVANPDPKPGVARREMLRRWCFNVQMYSLRSMKGPLDKLTALAGMAEFIQSTIECDYLFGIWTEDLTRGLLWTNQALAGMPEWRVPLKRPAFQRAPSWSWASVDGPVHYRITENEEQTFFVGKQLTKLISHKVPTRTFDPIRSQCSFELTLQGILKGVKISRIACQDHRSIDRQAYRRAEKEGRRQRRSLDERLNWGPAMKAMEKGLLSGFLLEPVETRFNASAESRIVGFGLLDIVGEDLGSDSLYVLPLVSNEGMLLAGAGPGKYRRVGTFWPERYEWYFRGEERDLVLI